MSDTPTPGLADSDLLSARILALQVIQTQTLAAVLGASENPHQLIALLRTNTGDFISRVRPEVQEEAARFCERILGDAFQAGTIRRE